MIQVARDKRPLHSNAAEMGVLGSAMLSGSAMRETRGIVSVEDFWRPAHRIIWRTMLDIQDIGLDGDQGIDYVVLINELKTNGELEDVGGKDYVLELAEFTPSPANARQYAEVVAEHAAVRRIQAKTVEIQERIEEGADSETLLAEALALQDARRYSSDDLTPWNEIPVQETESGVTTGWEEIDKLTGVGYVKGQLSAVSARQKGGKTSWILNGALAAARAGHRVCFATFADLSPVRLKRRALKHDCGFGGPPGNTDGFVQYDEAVRAMQEGRNGYKNMFVYDYRKQGKHIETFVGKIASFARREGLDAVYADYIQKITARTIPRAERTAQLQFISEQLDELAQRTGIAVIVGSQVNDDFTTQYAKAVEEDAGMVIRIGRDKDSEHLRTVEVPFNRFGPSATFGAEWDDETVRIKRLWRKAV